MPTESALDFRHVGDERRRLVVAPRLGTEMDEFTRVEMVRYPLDDLAHGNAATCSDIVGPIRVRCRQQAHEQVGDIRCINKIPNLTAVAHADRLTCAQCSQQGRNEAPWLVARPVRQKHARPCGGKAVTLRIGLDRSSKPPPCTGHTGKQGGSALRPPCMDRSRHRIRRNCPRRRSAGRHVRRTP